MPAPRPESAGAADDLLRYPAVDGPTIGILLCKSKDNTVVEYALRGIAKPIGVSQMELRTTLPEGLSDQLPTVEDLEAELRTATEDAASDPD